MSDQCRQRPASGRTTAGPLKPPSLVTEKPLVKPPVRRRHGTDASLAIKVERLRGAEKPEPLATCIARAQRSADESAGGARRDP